MSGEEFAFVCHVKLAESARNGNVMALKMTVVHKE